VITVPDFFQDAPRLGNQYDDDAALRAVLARLLPDDVRADAEPGLRALGGRVVGEIAALGDEAERDPPRLVRFDPWGRRIDRIDVSAAWRALERIAAEEGLVARGYERRYGAWSRLEQFARLYLFHPSSATATCPLAMADGAARCLELYADDDPRLRAAFGHLTTRDPDRFWTAGQWMTERTGGSDVSLTSTVARRDDDDWRLHGVKWFTSATTSPMALTLARIERDGAVEPGSAGLSLFFVETRDPSGALRGIVVERLKDKLGTRALPTAELRLDGTPAVLVGGEGGGVRKISAVLNITRLYNAACAAAMMRRTDALATDYARRRVAFGRTLTEHPLHVETLAAMATEAEGALQLVAHAWALLGREECGEATDEERAVLRVITPVAKLLTGKQAVAVASEGLEAFGGAGYIEDTGFPRLLRDAQVLSIWEGTTNVLSLDVLRALARGGAMHAIARGVRARLAMVVSPERALLAARVDAALGEVERDAARLAGGADAEASAGARTFAMSLGRVYAASLLLAQAEWERSPRAEVAARRWCERGLVEAVHGDAARLAGARALLGLA
jgi:alkylation response protein AidB-like acyl-CoA dehydrogenase